MQNEKSLSLRSPELLPTKDSERNLSLWDYTILWAGMTINIVAFSLGAQYFNGGDGLSPWMLVLVVFLGYGLVTFLTCLLYTSSGNCNSRTAECFLRRQPQND